MECTSHEIKFNGTKEQMDRMEKDLASLPHVVNPVTNTPICSHKDVIEAYFPLDRRENYVGDIGFRRESETCMVVTDLNNYDDFYFLPAFIQRYGTLTISESMEYSYESGSPERYEYPVRTVNPEEARYARIHGCEMLANKEENKFVVFLLGGKDLEMARIKEIFDHYNYHIRIIPYIDNGLDWGASEDDYAKELAVMPADVEVVGIELSPGKFLKDHPEIHYTSIDHHNGTSEKSSLEQVVELLNADYGFGYEMSRRDLLISANDKGYIPAMLEMGATAEAVDFIRRADRHAQGVTKEEESEAERLLPDGIDFRGKEVAEFEVGNGISHFSPITDRMFYLGTQGNSPSYGYTVLNGHELCYYGPMAHELGETVFAGQCKTGKAYFGGAKENGYFGIAYDALSPDELRRVAKDIHALADRKALQKSTQAMLGKLGTEANDENLSKGM